MPPRDARALAAGAGVSQARVKRLPLAARTTRPAWVRSLVVSSSAPWTMTLLGGSQNGTVVEPIEPRLADDRSDALRRERGHPC
jgi:hypothetical protein